MSTNKRFDHLDLLKTYAILVVITLHTQLWSYDVVNSHSISTIMQYGARMLSEGVPIFLFINGFLLLKKEEFNLEKHLRKTGKIFAILVLWAVILGVGGFYLQNPGQQLDLLNLWNIVTGVSLGSQYNGVLWFLVYLVQVYLIFPIIWKIYHSDFKLYLYFFAVVAFFAVGINTLQFIRDFVSIWFDPTAFDSFNSFVNRFTPFGYVYYIYYFMLGGIFWHYYGWLKEKGKMLGLGSLISWIALWGICFFMSQKLGYVYRPSGNFDTIFAQVFFTGIFAVTIPYKKRGNIIQKWIASVGTHTMGIYLSHFIFIFAYTRFIPFGNSFFCRLEEYLLVVISSYIFAIVTSRIPVIKKIVTI